MRVKVVKDGAGRVVVVDAETGKMLEGVSQVVFNADPKDHPGGIAVIYVRDKIEVCAQIEAAKKRDPNMDQVVLSDGGVWISGEWLAAQIRQHGSIVKTTEGTKHLLGFDESAVSWYATGEQANRNGHSRSQSARDLERASKPSAEEEGDDDDGEGEDDEGDGSDGEASAGD